jgi:hypothetical protein
VSIKSKLEANATQTSQHLLQIKISKAQYKILRVVAQAWNISVAELVRRCCNLVLAQIKDRAILTKIQGIKLSEGINTNER